MQELRRRALFVTDRSGEISAQWVVAGHEFPGIGETPRSLDLVEIACEECGVPEWPAGEAPVASCLFRNSHFGIRWARRGTRASPRTPGAFAL